MMFKNLGFKTNNIIHLTPREAYEICNENAILVDVREDFMIGYKKFEVKQTLYFPASTLESTYQKLPKDSPLVFADASGLHSKEMVVFLFKQGYTNIANMAGGLVEWERDGLPLKVNSKEELSGQCPCQLTAKKK